MSKSMPKLQVSFSGGRTSAFMSIWLKKNFSSFYDMHFVFANTGWEHPDTLRFVNEIDTRFELNLTWVEAVANPGRKSSSHRIVNYQSASRNGEPYEAVVQKYGIPNQVFSLCTRELKLNPMNSYMRSIGLPKGCYETAIGIRADEQRRVRKESALANRIVYPLATWFPTTKEQVLDFFEDFDWDLKIPEHQGNCIGCFKKSEKKLLRLYQEDAKNFEFPIKLEHLYSNVGPNNVPGPRKMYRGYRSASDLVAQFETVGADYKPGIDDGGCSESCEIYETEIVK